MKKHPSSRREFLKLTATLAAVAGVNRSGFSLPAPQPAWNPPSSYTCPRWFKEAKFGIWLHWGPQTLPLRGGGWYARHMYMGPSVLPPTEQWGKDAWTYHRETFGHQSEVGYKDVCNLWKAEHFDAQDTICTFKNWGARYVAILANHHDNFDLFDSRIHRWNSKNVGPKRDIVGEFSAAARDHDLKWAATVHMARARRYLLPAFGSDIEGPKKGLPYDGNLTEAQGAGTWWEGLDPQQLYASKYSPFDAEMTQRHMDLVMNYRPDLIYFDDAQIPLPIVPACQWLFDESLRRNGRVQSVITVKSAQPGTLLDFEKGVAGDIRDEPWQTDTTLAEDWFLKPGANGKSVLRHSTRSLKELLIDVVSKRGVLLLNVAAYPDGTIPPEQRQIMDAFGLWLKANGEAIFATHPWKVHGEGGATVDGPFKERGIDSTSWDCSVVRFTQHPDNRILYAHVFGAPAGKEITIASLGADRNLLKGRIEKIKIVGSQGTRVLWNVARDCLRVTMPSTLPHEDCNILEISTTNL